MIDSLFAQPLKYLRSSSYDSKFWEITGNILEMVLDGDIVTMED